MIHLDAHDGVPPCSLALDWIRSSLEGPLDREQIQVRKEMIFDFLGAESSSSFLFTSSGAEAINQVLFSVFLEISRKEGKTHFVTTCLEDAPTMQMLKRLEGFGCFVKIAPVNSRGEVDLAAFEKMIGPRTALVSLSMAQGLTGVVQPYEEMARIAKEKKALVHFDATYAIGKLSFSFRDLDADYLTFGGDRLHAWKSTGGLFAKEKQPLVPFIVGGNSFDAPLFFSLAAAMQQASLFLDAMSLEVARLRDFLEYELMRQIPGARPLFEEAMRLPNTTVMVFPRVHADALHYYLKRKKVVGSMGGLYAQHLSRLLMASGLDERRAETALSFSLSRYTTEAELLKAAQIIVETVHELQNVSAAVF